MGEKSGCCISQWWSAPIGERRGESQAIMCDIGRDAIKMVVVVAVVVVRKRKN